MTAAPSLASAVAMANPMPAVEPVTSAVFPFKSRSIPDWMRKSVEPLRRSYALQLLAAAVVHRALRCPARIRLHGHRFGIAFPIDGEPPSVLAGLQSAGAATSTT